jgi:multiple sugar transport system substrate-binding protein
MLHRWLLGRGVRLLTAFMLATTLASAGWAPVAQVSQPTRIVFWHMPNGATPAAAVQAEIAAFTQLYPDIQVEAQQVSWAEAFLRIQTAVQGGEGPDVTQLGTTWVPGFTAMGGLREYTPQEVAAVGGETAFSAATWSTRGVAGTEVVSSIPWFSDVRALAYRSDVLAKVNLSPEMAFADMTSFEKSLRTIKESNPDIAPFVHPGRNDWNVWQNTAMFIWAYGGELLTPDGKTAAFNSPEAVAGISHFYSLYGKGLTAVDTLELNSSQTEERFGQGLAATVITGSYVISSARTPAEQGGWLSDDAKANLAFAPIPTGPGGQYTFVGGSNLAILKSSKHQDAALKWVNFLLSYDSQVRYGQAIGMLPATLTGRSDPAFANDPLYSTLGKIALTGKTAPPIAQWGQVEPALQEGLVAMWDDVVVSNSPIPVDLVQERMNASARAVNNLLR